MQFIFPTQCKAQSIMSGAFNAGTQLLHRTIPIQSWPQALKALFKKAIALEINMTQQQYRIVLNAIKLKQHSTTYSKYRLPPVENYSHFLKRMVKNRDALFTFLHYPEATQIIMGQKEASEM